MAEQEERTEQATPRRRQKAREKGQLAKSRELVSMSTIAGSLLVLYYTGALFMKNISTLMGRLLGLRYGTEPLAVMRSASIEMLWILAPLFGVTVLFAVLANVAQSGFLLKPLTFEVERLSPLAGWKNLFSVSSLPGIFKSTAKFAIGCILFYYIIKQILLVLPATSTLDLIDLQRMTVKLTYRAVITTFSVFFVLALADFFYERWRFERSIRMSKEEIREEQRESEGDPMIKSRIKSLQREMARRRMMQAVPKATVVITNPTHIAVALLYDKNTMSAPQIIAKGKGVIAERIKEIAREHRIPLVEDKPLARALVKGKLDSFIPEELYRAVAKILAYIYKLRGAAA